MIQRPSHLVSRQISGRMFGEAAILRSVTLSRDAFGAPSEIKFSRHITLATAPATGNNARVRELQEGGIELSAMRQFWLAEEVKPVAQNSAGDIIDYGGDQWRCHAVEEWGGFYAVVGVLIR